MLKNGKQKVVKNQFLSDGGNEWRGIFYYAVNAFKIDVVVVIIIKQKRVSTPKNIVEPMIVVSLKKKIKGDDYTKTGPEVNRIKL